MGPSWALRFFLYLHSANSRARYYVSLRFLSSRQVHLPHFEGSFCYHLVSPLNGSFQRCSCGLFTAWKADGQAEGQTQCHLPGCHSYSLLTASPVFLVLLQALACIFLGICSLQIIFRNCRGMNPRLTTSAFMRSSEKRVADEFKRNLILAWAQPAFLVVLGVRQACAHRRASRGQRTTRAHSLLSALPLCSHSKHHGRKLQRWLAWSL